MEQDFECFVKRGLPILVRVKPDIDFDMSRRKIKVVQVDDFVWIATVTPFQSNGLKREDLNFQIKLTFDRFYRPDTADIYMELSNELLVSLVQIDPTPPDIH